MKKYCIIFLFVILCILTISAVLLSQPVISYGVDGSSANMNVVIKNRNPVVFFEVIKEYVVIHYEIKISSFYNGLSLQTTVYHVVKTTDTVSTINNITRTEIPNNVLQENLTYYLELDIYLSSPMVNISTYTIFDTFFVTSSAVSLEGSLSLEIDQNNPFCPIKGETTMLRYMVKNKDVPIKLYIFSFSGKYIKTLANQLALKDMVYTVIWDGKDETGRVLPPGVYLAVLSSADTTPVIKYIGIKRE